MKTPRLKAFEAWVSVDDSGVGNWWLCDTRQLCLDYCAPDQRPVRVIVRDAREDSEARLRRENARLRRLLDRTRDALVGGKYGIACQMIAEELERGDRR